MKIIPVLFKRKIINGIKFLCNEVSDESKWVIDGKGTATIKYDGIPCLIRNGKLYKRYVRKLNRGQPILQDQNIIWFRDEDFETVSNRWEPVEEPNYVKGLWPGWMPIRNELENSFFFEAFESELINGTYELVGPNIAGNPYRLDKPQLLKHGSDIIEIPRTFEGIRNWLESNNHEGIVWHNDDGRMTKIRRKDFGLPWPLWHPHLDRRVF